jgi:sigma-B regulation protein RsbQ
VIAPSVVGEYLAKHLRNSKLVVLDATGHCPNLSAPDETIAAINAFLS